MNPIIFRQMIKRVLKEEVEKESSSGVKIFNRLPEVKTGEDYKKITPYKRDDKSKESLLDDMSKIVNAIDKDFKVIWDDHDDISITARDLFNIRIIPKWENNYDIEFYIRNEDRIHITGQTWDQVKAFVKINLKENKTYVEKAADKVIANRKDQITSPDKGLSQENKPKTLPLTSEPPSETKNKEKNYTEKDVKKDSDLPNAPMKESGKVKNQSEHPIKGTKPEYKYPKQKDTNLVSKDKKTPKLK